MPKKRMVTNASRVNRSSGRVTNPKNSRYNTTMNRNTSMNIGSSNVMSPGNRVVPPDVSTPYQCENPLQCPQWVYGWGDECNGTYNTPPPCPGNCHGPDCPYCEGNIGGWCALYIECVTCRGGRNRRPDPQG